MKKLRMGVLLLLGAAGVAGAQEENSPAGRTNAAPSFEQTSAAKVNLLVTNEESSAAPSVAMAAGEGAASATPEAPAAPAAKPKFVFGDRDDYRWQLGFGVEVFRFLSSRFVATMAGTNTMVTYFTNGWLRLKATW